MKKEQASNAIVKFQKKGSPYYVTEKFYYVQNYIKILLTSVFYISRRYEIRKNKTVPNTIIVNRSQKILLSHKIIREQWFVSIFTYKLSRIIYSFFGRVKSRQDTEHSTKLASFVTVRRCWIWCQIRTKCGKRWKLQLIISTILNPFYRNCSIKSQRIIHIIR
jgi:hypothetical protein